MGGDSIKSGGGLLDNAVFGNRTRSYLGRYLFSLALKGTLNDGITGTLLRYFARRL